MKTILKYTVITAFAIIGTYGIYSSVRSQKSEVMSDVMKANVEALAEPQDDPDRISAEEFKEKTGCVCTNNGSCSGKDGHSYKYAARK